MQDKIRLFRAASLATLVALSGILAFRPASRAGGWGVIGDSGADEYRANDNRGGLYAATTFNWVELLVRNRSFDFGAWGTRTGPRRTGYAQNWARSGATSYTLLSTGQHSGLASQITAGVVSNAVVQIGANDFSTFGKYDEIYFGTLAGAALQAELDRIVANISMALQTLVNAGADNVFWFTIPDRGLNPVYVAQFPDPARRQLVSNAVNQVNDRVTAVAGSLDVTVIDMTAFTASLFASIDANGMLPVGGELINLLVPGDEPHHFILGDREHAGTVCSGLIANYLIAAFNTRGLGVEPFSPTEILTFAGIIEEEEEDEDLEPPVVTFTEPALGATLSGIRTIAVSATDNDAVVGVQFRIDGVAIGGEELASPYTQSLDTRTVANGAHTLTATARDPSGNVTTRSLAISVSNDLTAPVVSITAPAAGAVVAGTVSITANATDNVGVVGVQFAINGVNFGAEDTSAPYGTSWSTALVPNGAYTITATARDAVGHTAVTTRTVTVNNVIALPTLVLFPATFAVQAGALNGGNTASLAADDNNYLAVRSSFSGLTATSRTEFRFGGAAGPATRIDVRVVARSSTSSTRLTIAILNVGTGAWTTISSPTIGTGEQTLNTSITSSPNAYIGADGTVALRVTSSKLLGSHTFSVDMARVTVVR